MIKVALEEAESYIDSQRAEGWTALPEQYSDGGFSGGNTNRPALQKLIADIEAGSIAVVVVYKYDRLSRSMLDFLQLLDFFKKHGVSFVSVSQRFDTSTPVGEMTLNILLSFAQFERQIIGERTRDKIQAARRRGRWTGGMPPLGYDVAAEGGRLDVNRVEAEQVYATFELYAEIPSLVKVAQELNRRGWRKKSWTTKTGKHRQGGKWDRVSLRRLLTDPLYIGMQKLGDAVFPGEHRGIVPKALFDKVQRAMFENRDSGGAGARNQYGALLRGLMRCSACNRAMTHVPTKRRGRLYRYYRCQAAQKNGAACCPTGSVTADRVESFVVEQIRRIGSDPELQRETFRQAQAQLKADRRGLKAEAKRLERDLAAARTSVEKLVRTLTDTEGAARDAVQDQLEKAQQHVETLETRLVEIHQQQADLKAQTIDEADVAAALEDFDELWSVLLTPERERILKLLIDRVEYSGETQELSIAWRLAGFADLADEVGSG